jgi:hypothetical protein
MVIKDAYLPAPTEQRSYLSHLADLVALPFRFERRERIVEYDGWPEGPSTVPAGSSGQCS